MADQPVTNFDIVNAMHDFGGSFVQALAVAFERADADNFTKLKAAFPEYWAQYADMAVLRKARA